MKTPRSFPLTLAAAWSLAALSAAAFANGPQEDLSHLRYRCSVLGDNPSCAALPAPVRPAMERVPGSYASKLITVNGTRVEEAIAAARASGEEPRLLAVPPERQLSGYERHERWMGRLPSFPTNERQARAEPR